ncbi:MAG TPA: hypothetical protein VH137_03295, partial [Gemmatimonadales bacterium]|nr:hypothetical protein [Gemmatimonadales bacterium]
VRFRIVVFDDPYYYPYRYYGGTRVVFTRPFRPEPRFIFKDRQASDLFITRVRERPVNTDDRRRDVGVRGRDLGGTGVIPPPNIIPPRQRPSTDGHNNDRDGNRGRGRRDQPDQRDRRDGGGGDRPDRPALPERRGIVANPNRPDRRDTPPPPPPPPSRRDQPERREQPDRPSQPDRPVRPAEPERRAEPRRETPASPPTPPPAPRAEPRAEPRREPQKDNPRQEPELKRRKP